ncbi:ribosome maturation factor RimP [Hoeflea sp. WL0058]|uniref:Ribosome maturation factor RimP n=1 Tax=Flavimaribacter sediminis TaxID=2865987 RepID=A0AAE2ZNF3_9HYPH|nr:ribosome maturation factor RimP [Flavimaribacter sediminis]
MMSKSGPHRTRSFCLSGSVGESRLNEQTKPLDNESEEPRLVTETGVEARIAAIVEPVLQSIDFRLVRVRLSGQNGLTLQIMAERNDGAMTVEDCEAVSRALSPVLDVEDPIDRAYHLEVSSPGIDRPMVRRSDFTRWQGHLMKCETSVPVEDRRRFKGRIAAAEDDAFMLERNQPGYGEALTVRIPFEALTEARLILTDDLIRDALAADKAAKAARAKREETGNTH